MKILYLTLSSVFILCCIVTVIGQIKSPAEERARELVQIFNSADRAQFQKYVEANFGAEMRGLPMDRHLNCFSSVYDNSRGFEISDVQEAKSNQVTMLVKCKLTGEWDALLVAVESEVPYRITRIGFRQPKPPTNKANNAKKLSKKEIFREMDSFFEKAHGSRHFFRCSNSRKGWYSGL